MTPSKWIVVLLLVLAALMVLAHHVWGRRKPQAGEIWVSRSWREREEGFVEIVIVESHVLAVHYYDKHGKRIGNVTVIDRSIFCATHCWNRDSI